MPTTDPTETASRGSESAEPAPKVNPHHARNRAMREQMLEVAANLADARASGASTRAVERLERALDRVKAEIYLANKGLVAAEVRRFRRTDGSSGDYFSAGTEGFLEALAKWDPAEGAELGTFARPYITGKIRRSVHATEVTGISYGDWTARAVVKKAAAELEHSLGRRPTDEELAADTKLTVTLVARVRAAQPTSLSTPVGDGDMTLADLVTDVATSGTPLADLLNEKMLAKLAATLDARQLWVLVRRQGLDSSEPQTLVEIQAETGLGREVLRRAEKRAMAVLAEALAEGSAESVLV